MAYVTVDPQRPKDYPPNIQAVLKAPSPASAYLGLELLEVDTEVLRVRIAFNAEDRLCNKWGGLHGGMVAAMLDDCMAIAVGLSLEWGEISPTLEMKSSFIVAGRPGRLVGEGWTVKRGKSVAFLEAELRDAGGGLVATGSSTARIVQTKRDKRGAAPRPM
ncbi:PaaI family thioesterase [bacterium AH-315-P15]|nr:PaaI family thioesterase [bacterium AH-315-P15]